MSEHALLSASSSERWINCPGSIALCKDIPNTTSKYAEEGTRAHERAGAILLDPKVDVCSDDPVMLEHIMKYVQLVRDLTGDGVLMVEKRVDYSSYIGVENSFGTSDAIIVNKAGDEVICVDLKYGMGIRVDAEDNSQLMLYALGTLDELSVMGYDIKRVKMVIHQPRLDHISEWECNIDYLLDFADKAKIAAMKATHPVLCGDPEGMADLNPGQNQCRFCPAKSTCPALGKYVCAATEDMFDIVTDELTPETLDLVEQWIKAKRGELEARLFKGEKLQHWKLVEGRRGNAAWSDAKAVEEMFKGMRMKQEVMYDLSLISPTTATKLFKDHPIKWGKVEKFITRKDGKPSVASIKDKRPALQITDVSEGFNDLTNQEGDD